LIITDWEPYLLVMLDFILQQLEDGPMTRQTSIIIIIEEAA
jgi:hypothetical protein